MKLFKVCLGVLFVVGFGWQCRSQQFTDIRANLTGVAESAARWMDTDRDGDLDILVSGEFYRGNQPGVQTFHYRNMRNDRFVLAQSSGLPQLFRGDIAIGDLDLDGIEDVIMMGETANGTRMTSMFKGIGNGSFAATTVGFMAVRDGSVDLADFDGDGDLDVLVAGESVNGPVCLLYRNDRNGRFTLINAGLTGIRRGVARWTDFNLDGRPDVIITGIGSNGNPVTSVFQNTSEGFRQINTGMMNLKNSNLAFGDYDNDGDDDIVLIGETQQGQPRTLFYNNNRRGAFTPVQHPFPNVKDGFADWADMDLDGDLDLLISGQSAQGPVSMVFRNDRNGKFTNINAGIIPLYNSSGEWGDYDLDGDQDILIAGLTSDNQLVTRVYKNQTIEQRAPQRQARTVQTESMWLSDGPSPERSRPVYYFVYSSSYSDLHQNGKKDYYLFISPVKRFSKHYVLQEKYNEVIMDTYPTWGRIDQGNIVQNGFAIKSEADKSRERVINEYRSKGFKLIEVNW